MNDDEIWKWLNEIGKGAETAQAIAMANNVIVQRLVAQWALVQKDPIESVQRMHEAISAGLDKNNKLNFSDAEHRVFFRAREMVDGIFSQLNVLLQERKNSEDKRKPRQN